MKQARGKWTASKMAVGVVSIAAALVWLIYTLAFLNSALTSSASRLYSLVSLLVALSVGVFSTFLARSVRAISRTRQVFLSYPEAVAADGEKIERLLSDAGATVWTARKAIKPGDRIELVIRKALEDSDRFVMLLRGPVSEWQRRELQLAKANHLRIVPVLIHGATLPDFLEDIKAIDLERNPVDGLRELVSVAA
jgi:hypothetical protein